MSANVNLSNGSAKMEMVVELLAVVGRAKRTKLHSMMKLGQGLNDVHIAYIFIQPV